MNDRSKAAPHNGHDQASAQEGSPTSRGTRAQERIAALDTKGASLAAHVEELEAQLAEASRRADEAEVGWQRARADFSNLKRRVEEERTERADSASDRLLSRVLELADDFDLAVEHVPDDVKGTPWVEGIGAIDRKLRALLEAEGVKPMGSEGEPFDPHTQQAISYEDSVDVPDGTVLRVLQRGYTVRDRVLRPALVAVARNDETPPIDTPETNDD
jgi:molecular chaperone GrpE